MPANSPSRILRLKSVLDRTGLSRSTLYRKMQDRSFPRPLRISKRCAGWRESDVEAWVLDPESFPLEPLPRDPLEVE